MAYRNIYAVARAVATSAESRYRILREANALRYLAFDRRRIA